MGIALFSLLAIDARLASHIPCVDKFAAAHAVEIWKLIVDHFCSFHSGHFICLSPYMITFNFVSDIIFSTLHFSLW